MSREKSTHRITSNSRFGPGLDWAALPELGGARRGRISYRAAVWRWIIAGLIGFWVTLAWWIAT
ncbi:MAG: hypothetical protein ABL914_10915 [Novosphingobium sp.]|uniref:hypothetical protein n=1 Tax=Novosphingobium sp. TaxID=1874826 RepID=UPI0032BDDDCD